MRTWFQMTLWWKDSNGNLSNWMNPNNWGHHIYHFHKYHHVSIFLAVYISASVNMSNIIPNSLSMQGERKMGKEGKGLFVFAVMAESKGAIGNILCRNLISWSKVHFLYPSHGFSNGNIAYCVLQSWIFILVSENNLFLILGSGTSSARNENLRPLLNINIPLIRGRYGLRNHFWPLESCFLTRKSDKKGPN